MASLRTLLPRLTPAALIIAVTACGDGPADSPLALDDPFSRAVLSGLTMEERGTTAEERSTAERNTSIENDNIGASAVPSLTAASSSLLTGLEVISFDELPAFNTNFVTLSDEYQDKGVLFITDDGALWDGLDDTDPGNWGLNGTNGSQFVGFNGTSYTATINFAANVSDLSIDAARSNGSSSGDGFQLEALCDATLVDSDGFTFGAINVWQTASVTAPCINSVVITGTGSGFHPFGADNLRITFSPRLVSVDIDIKPTSTENPIKIDVPGTIPVAVLSDPDFDAGGSVDATTLTFGQTGDENSLVYLGNGDPQCGSQDVNGDSLEDLVCHFRTADTGFETGDAEGVLKGETTNGTALEGTDDVSILD